MEFPSLDTEKDRLPMPESRLDTQDAASEEDYTIKCVCGFEDDDGHTALCEQCNTWQHVDCYYFPHNLVPDIHKCIDCFPRSLPAGALDRQRRRREALNSSDGRKGRRPLLKAHKKQKLRDLIVPDAFDNYGWSLGNEDADIMDGQSNSNIASVKRPKLSHKFGRPLIGQPLSAHVEFDQGRELPLSQSESARELSRSYYSEKFMQAYASNADFRLTNPGDSNEWSDLAIASEFSKWLDDPDAFNKVSNGRRQSEVFQRTAEPLQNWDWPVKKKKIQSQNTTFNGQHPTWHVLTANRSIQTGHFIGELIGTIGHRQDYKEDPRNNWEILRHPDHFVFFHPVLPIYIDCRKRGSLMRYVRRGCFPNVSLTTIVTGERDVHFCFTSLSRIEEGDEIVVAWNTQEDEELNAALTALATRNGEAGGSQNLRREHIVGWVANLLAHFGDCACKERREPAASCLLSQFDMRTFRAMDLDKTASLTPIIDARYNFVPDESARYKANHTSRIHTSTIRNGREGVAKPGERSLVERNAKPTFNDINQPQGIVHKDARTKIQADAHSSRLIRSPPTVSSPENAAGFHRRVSPQLTPKPPGQLTIPDNHTSSPLVGESVVNDDTNRDVSFLSSQTAPEDAWSITAHQRQPYMNTATQIWREQRLVPCKKWRHRHHYATFSCRKFFSLRRLRAKYRYVVEIMKNDQAHYSSSSVDHQPRIVEAVAQEITFMNTGERRRASLENSYASLSIVPDSVEWRKTISTSLTSETVPTNLDLDFKPSISLLLNTLIPNEYREVNQLSEEPTSSIQSSYGPLATLSEADLQISLDATRSNIVRKKLSLQDYSQRLKAKTITGDRI